MGWSRDRLAAVAERTGYPVHAAWVTGHGTMGEIMGCMLHHTATPNSYMPHADIPTLKILREGRSDLAGPLCNYGLARSGAIWLITDGLGWHAGKGEYRGVTLGATHFLGIEAENGGRGADKDPWPDAQLDAYQRLVASILHEKGDKDTTWDIRHARWALPAGRKTDTAGFDLTAFDRKVQAMLDKPSTINKNTTQEDDVPLTQAEIDKIADAVWKKKLSQDWDGVANEAGDVLVSAQRYSIDGAFPGKRPPGNGSPGTDTFAAQVWASLTKITTLVADDPTLDEISAVLAEKLADAGGTIDAAAVREALLGIEFGPRPNTP